jgi:hypothetical protein
MENLQDLAVNKLTVLDQSIDTSLLCMGDATFKKNIKVYNNIHLQKDIRIRGNILPIEDTSSIGLEDKQWLKLYASSGKFNKIDVDVLNVKQINCLDIEKKEKKEKKEYEYINVNDKFSDKVNINVKTRHHIVIYDLSDLTISIKETIHIYLNKNNVLNKVKIIFINPSNYDIKFEGLIDTKNDAYLIYEFLYVNELNRFIIVNIIAN